jgi:AhpD family alkylhydroperoxidase
MSHHQHQARIDYTRYGQLAPEITGALIAMGKAVEASGLEKSLTELVKLRISQINGCAFCLQYHLNVARDLEVPQTKLDMLPTWRESSYYSARERAALAWAEALTFIATKPVTDEMYVELQSQFSESEIAYLSASIGTINFWNRLGGALGFNPPPSTVR